LSNRENPTMGPVSMHFSIFTPYPHSQSTAHIVRNPNICLFKRAKDGNPVNTLWPWSKITGPQHSTSVLET
jgi:hypothetical protein